MIFIKILTILVCVLKKIIEMYNIILTGLGFYWIIIILCLLSKNYFDLWINYVNVYILVLTKMVFDGVILPILGGGVVYLIFVLK